MGLSTPSIPDGWTRVTVDAVCEILDSARRPVNSTERSRRIAGKADDHLYPYYGATGQVGVIDDFIFEGEHILLGEDGAPFLDPFKAKSYLVKDKFWVNNHAHILQSVLSNKYLCHYLNQLDYSGHVTGTTRLKLTKNALKNIPVRFAPEAEQHRIVAKIEELFSELDKGVESLKKAREQLKVYRQAVLKHAFEGKLTAQWREENKDKLETPEQLLARIKQEREAHYEQQVEEWKAAVRIWEEGGRDGKKPRRPRTSSPITESSKRLADKGYQLPTGWTWATIGVLFDVVSGSTPRGLGQVRGKDIPFYKVSDMNSPGNETRMDASTIYLSDLERNALGLPTYPKDTVIFPKRGGAILTNKKRILSRPSCFDLNTMGVVNSIENISNEYLWHWFQALDLAEIYDGSNVPQINNKNVEPLLFPICSIEEQREIACILEETFSLLTNVETTIIHELRRANTLRQSILKKAFSGQIVPQDPNDEPASVLLERIKAEKAA